MPIQAHKMGVSGDFGPLNVIIYHPDPQKAHPCVNPRLLSYHALKIRLRGMTCRRVDRKCDTHTHTGKFIFCPMRCILHSIGQTTTCTDETNDR